MAPHLFHRTGDPVIDYGDFEKIMPQFAGLSEAGVLNDIDAAIAYLGEQGFSMPRIGVVGFCMGGTVAFLASVRRPLGAGVTFYGGGVTEGRFGVPSMVELAPELKAPWLGLYGEEDQGIPVDQVEALRAAVGGATVDTEIVRLSGRRAWLSLRHAPRLPRGLCHRRLEAHPGAGSRSICRRAETRRRQPASDR